MLGGFSLDIFACLRCDCRAGTLSIHFNISITQSIHVSFYETMGMAVMWKDIDSGIYTAGLRRSRRIKE